MKSWGKNHLIFEFWKLMFTFFPKPASPTILVSPIISSYFPAESMPNKICRSPAMVKRPPIRHPWVLRLNMSPNREKSSPFGASDGGEHLVRQAEGLGGPWQWELNIIPWRTSIPHSLMGHVKYREFAMSSARDKCATTLISSVAQRLPPTAQWEHH